MQSAVTGQPSSAPPPPAGRNKQAVGETLLWIGILIILTVGAGMAILWYRRRLLSRSSATDTGGLMEEFRRMRDSGEMTLEEYEATKRALVSKMAGSAARTIPRAPMPGKQGPDNKLPRMRSGPGEA